MKAISLWQPWATLMAAGYKRIETRSWAPHELKQGQLVAIHAAKHWTDEERYTCEGEPFTCRLREAETRGLWNFDKPPLGCVVAIARFSHVVSTSYDAPSNIAHVDFTTMTDEEYTFGNYSYGRLGWVFSEVRPLQPIPTLGKRGIFDWTPPANIGDLYVEALNRAVNVERARLTHGLTCERCGCQVEPVTDYDPDFDRIMCVSCGQSVNIDEWEARP